MDVVFDLDLPCQLRLEQTVARVVSDLAIRRGDQTVVIKDRDDEQIRADVLADSHYQKLAQADNACYLSEESESLGDFADAHLSGALLYIVDPIDGSSEFARVGPMRSPLSTAIMALRGGRVIAASVGDIWQREIFGLDSGSDGKTALSVRNVDEVERRYPTVSSTKRRLALGDAMVAGYAPSHKGHRIDLLLPLFDAAAYVHNNGGQPFALQVASGESSKSYAVALELVPKELWEHIGPILASAGGASVTRLDGKPLEVDPTLRQTSITAASPALAEEVRQVLAASHQRLGVAHRERIRV